jgi:hypothetical protein
MLPNFSDYLQQLVLLAFFAGYPLLYAVVGVVAESRWLRGRGAARMVALLPYAYALTGVLYGGFQAQAVYNHYAAGIAGVPYSLPWAGVWGLSAILFWIPALARKTGVSLAHSLVFFWVVVKDIFGQITHAGADSNILRNDMKLYTASFLMQAMAWLLLLAVSGLGQRLRARCKNRRH